YAEIGLLVSAGLTAYNLSVRIGRRITAGCDELDAWPRGGMADAGDLKSPAPRGVWVRVPSRPLASFRILSHPSGGNRNPCPWIRDGNRRIRPDRNANAGWERGGAGQSRVAPARWWGGRMARPGDRR